MKEKFSDRIKRKARLKYLNFLMKVIKKAVQKYDDIELGAFMALSLGRDETTTYHVMAERSYPQIHIFGTRIERLIDGEWVVDE